MLRCIVVISSFPLLVVELISSSSFGMVLGCVVALMSDDSVLCCVFFFSCVDVPFTANKTWSTRCCFPFCVESTNPLKKSRQGAKPFVTGVHQDGPTTRSRFDEFLKLPLLPSEDASACRTFMVSSCGTASSSSSRARAVAAQATPAQSHCQCFHSDASDDATMRSWKRS